MRLGPFDVTRRAVTAAAENPTPRARRERGASGTVNIDGFLQPTEYLAELRWPQGLKVWDRMSRSDASVEEALQHITAPVKNATASIHPPENPTVDELVATELVRRAFFEWLGQPWTEYLDQVLDYLPFGHAVFETPLAIVDADLRIPDPAGGTMVDGGRKVPRTISTGPRQWATWKRFAHRLPETILKWNVEDGDLVSVEQQVFRGRSYETVVLEARDLLVLTNRKRGDDFTGRSILRSAYKPWFFKELIEKVEAVSLERWGVGIPVAYPPQSLKDDDETLDRLEEILQSLRGGAFSYVVMPGPKQQRDTVGGVEGYLLELLSPSGTPPDFESAKQYHRSEIKAAVLARFAELGHGQTGARSTGDTQQQVWYDALHAVAKYIADAHAPKIKQLVDMNVRVDRYPTLVFEDIESKSLAEFAQANALLVNAGALRVDRGYRAFVRRSVDAPPEDDPEAMDEHEMEMPGEPTGPDDDGVEDEITPEEKRRLQDRQRQSGGGDA